MHKLKICLKELRESYRWLLLVQPVPLLRPKLMDPLVKETDELIRIFLRSIQTAPKRKQQPGSSRFDVRRWRFGVRLPPQPSTPNRFGLDRSAPHCNTVSR